MYRSIIELNPRFMNHQEYHVLLLVCIGKICSEELPRSGDGPTSLCHKKLANSISDPKKSSLTETENWSPWNLNVRAAFRFGDLGPTLHHLRVRWAIGSLRGICWPPTCPSKRGLPAWSWMSLHKSIDLAFPRNLQSHRVYISSQAMGLRLKTKHLLVYCIMKTLYYVQWPFVCD